MPRLPHPAVWFGLVRSEPGHFLWCRPARFAPQVIVSITASLMEGASGGSSLPLPFGHLVEPLLLESSAPRAGLPCPSPAPSPLTEHSWAFPQDWGDRAPVQAAQCPGALLLGTAEQRRPLGLVTWVCRSPALWPALPSC